MGVASGAGQFELVPHALDGLSDIDKDAYSHLPADPEAAALGFASGFEGLAQMLRDGDNDAVIAAFTPATRSVLGNGWDDVAWIGHWDCEISDVRCPVLLWYGEEDLMAPPAHGEWLQENLFDARLIIRPSEGHVGLVDHFPEVLCQLAELSTN